ncbi:hypothetical protein COV13_01760 [Candidatus Woesearchaeota archaeon CG10_big_fil_rev_8_21_14_0_10_32_9]|nr:MAG: hypothetical protein COV13_01760 [Candidatus Woesearchaeota archaeon CG10_big_fil_rev_8_21_14_0_10_32_9]
MKTKKLLREIVPSKLEDSDYEEDKLTTVSQKPKKEEAEELSGKLRKDNRNDKLLHSKIEVDKEKVDRAKALTDAINNNISSFSPDAAFDQLVNNYKSAKQLMGETLIRELTGYEPGFVEKNIKVPEFKKELKERIKQNLDNLEKDGLLNKAGDITEEGYTFASLSLLSEELDELKGKGLLGENEGKEISIYGERMDNRAYRQGDRYKDVDLKKTIKKSIRRAHTELIKQDLVVSERQNKGKIDVVYAIDTSGSMKGEKIRMAKKAGVALMYKAIGNKDRVGIVVFGSKIHNLIKPADDFYGLLKELTKIKTTGETDLSLAIDASLKLFDSSKNNKHLVLLTDALQTLGKKPESDVLEKVSVAHSAGISLTIIGINLNKQGEDFAKKIADVSSGSLYKVSDLKDIDQIIIEDYYNSKR